MARISQRGQRKHLRNVSTMSDKHFVVKKGLKLKKIIDFNGENYKVDVLMVLFH